jgi:hypothetical protein
MRMSRAIIFGFFSVMLFSACNKDKAGNGNCPGSCPTISFKSEIIPLFAANCALPACHNSSTSANRYINLDSAYAYASVMQVGTGYIVAGNPTSSILLSQLYAGVPNHMPNNGGQLDACSIQEISCWIQQGALNN